MMPSVEVLRDWLLELRGKEGLSVFTAQALEDPRTAYWAGRLLDADPALLDQAAREIYAAGLWPPNPATANATMPGVQWVAAPPARWRSTALLDGQGTSAATWSLGGWR